MVCRTLSVGGASSIATPVHIGGLSAQVPFIRQREALRSGNSSPLSRIIPTAGRMCVASPSSDAKTASSPVAVPRQARLLPIEGGDRPGHSRKAPFYAGVFVWRKAASNLAHLRTIDPNEGVDRFGRVTQAIGPEMAAMICPLDRSDDGDNRAPYAAVAISSAG